MAPQIGSKRKRAISGTENAHGAGKARAGGRSKRQRSDSYAEMTSEDDVASTMDVDNPRSSLASDDSEPDDGDLDSCQYCSASGLQHGFDAFVAEDYLINEATSRELFRLRKNHLVQLYHSTGLSHDAESFTKQEIVDAIIAARDDIVSLPPSSPLGRDGSSDYSSDDGNAAGGEETDIGGRCTNRTLALRRRATAFDLNRVSSKFTKGRSLSMGQLDHSTPDDHSYTRKVTRITDLPVDDIVPTQVHR